MIQEESEHQQAYAEHQESTKNLNNKNGDNSDSGNSIEDKIYKGMDHMERLLSGLESKYVTKEGKKKEGEEGVG